MDGLAQDYGIFIADVLNIYHSLLLSHWYI